MTKEDLQILNDKLAEENDRLRAEVAKVSADFIVLEANCEAKLKMIVQVCNG